MREGTGEGRGGGRGVRRRINMITNREGFHGVVDREANRQDERHNGTTDRQDRQDRERVLTMSSLTSLLSLLQQSQVFFRSKNTRSGQSNLPP